MAWYDEAVFYHIYPLGLTGAPKQNTYGTPEPRLRTLFPWITHIKEIGCNAIYIGPLFESVGHGYETTDYKKLDSRLGTNADLTEFVARCHKEGIHVILDGVFNHTGRDFFAFQDVKKNREYSFYKDWYCNVNFWGNNEFNDGFSYQNWGGYDLLAKLNQGNQEVRNYICDVIRFWVSEFDIDGIRLDAADVLDFGYMQTLRRVANEVKRDFWLMGEVIHGDYNRWVNEGTLHSVTNYHLHKALYSGHNDHNYFEIAHTVKRLYEMGGNRPDGLKLYNFVDNHDVERIYTKLTEKAHITPVHILLYTLPGVPSVYYGSEFGIEGKKEKYSDDSLRPALSLSDYADALEKNPLTKLIAALGMIRQATPALSYGDYKELLLRNRQYAFSRNYEGTSVLVTVNNDTSDFVMTLPAGSAEVYIGALSGERVSVNGGNLVVNVRANSGEIWIPLTEGVGFSNLPQTKPLAAAAETGTMQAATKESAAVGTVAAAAKTEPISQAEPVKTEATAQADSVKTEATVQADSVKTEATAQAGLAKTEPIAKAEPGGGSKEAEQEETSEQFERGRIAGLQEAILAIMEKNGPVTDQMRRDVRENVYHDSLITWIKSFR